VEHVKPVMNVFNVVSTLPIYVDGLLPFLYRSRN
jgi:hypothetical protein